MQSPLMAQVWVLVPLAAVTKVVGVPGSLAELLEDEEVEFPSPQEERTDAVTQIKTTLINSFLNTINFPRLRDKTLVNFH